jgi:uncharacterized flavoprotein (TIGR03862 family)
MPTPARKFLMAGKSGLNITHSAEFPDFIKQYGTSAPNLQKSIRAFGSKEIQTWAQELGTETFVGSSGRVFPKTFKASPLLRSWLERLSSDGVKIHTRTTWAGWDKSTGFCQFTGPDGAFSVNARATILALGGISWPKLGSVGEWQDRMQSKNIKMVPFTPSNCGFNIEWSPHFRTRYAGHPVKNCLLSFADMVEKGDVMITDTGIEGGTVYKMSSLVVQALELKGNATLFIDLAPDRPTKQLEQRLKEPQGKRSLTDHIRRKTGLKGAQLGLLRELASPKDLSDPQISANLIKKLPLAVKSSRPIEEAISVAGGISFEALDENLMLKALPGTFCAGEMVAWDAPTGGYLLTACLAQGKQAAKGAEAWLEGS